jgi:hypothetical protein
VLRRRITEGVHALGANLQVVVLDVPPVVGALASALTLAGADRTAIMRARQALR